MQIKETDKNISVIKSDLFLKKKEVYSIVSITPERIAESEKPVIHTKNTIKPIVRKYLLRIPMPTELKTPLTIDTMMERCIPLKARI